MSIKRKNQNTKKKEKDKVSASQKKNTKIYNARTSFRPNNGNEIRYRRTRLNQDKSKI